MPALQCCLAPVPVCQGLEETNTVLHHTLPAIPSPRDTLRLVAARETEGRSHSSTDFIHMEWRAGDAFIK